MNTNIPSKNIYQIPFIEKVNIKPAPFHYQHKKRLYAIDFALDVGTPIRSSREGIVHDIIDGYDEGGPKMESADKCNLIVLEHANEEYSIYAHLKKGILVEEGQQISTNELIGHSGISGFNDYPHLHYETRINHNEKWFSIPTRFQIDNEIRILISPPN